MKSLGVAQSALTGGTLAAHAAISGEVISQLPVHDEKAAAAAVDKAQDGSVKVAIPWTPERWSAR